MLVSLVFGFGFPLGFVFVGFGFFGCGCSFLGLDVWGRRRPRIPVLVTRFRHWFLWFAKDRYECAEFTETKANERPRPGTAL